MKGSKESKRIARQLIRACLPQGRLDESRVRLVVARLKQDKPRGYLGILAAFAHLVRLELAKREAVIETATDLYPVLAANLENDLRERHGSDLNTVVRVNPDLIGGMRIRVGNNVWDGSVRARLQQLSDTL